MKHDVVLRGLAVLASCLAIVVGCGQGQPEGELPAAGKSLTPEESADAAKKIYMMKGSGYKGAPGVPNRPPSK
jgi:hypothetical protein